MSSPVHALGDPRDPNIKRATLPQVPGETIHAVKRMAARISRIPSATDFTVDALSSRTVVRGGP